MLDNHGILVLYRELCPEEIIELGDEYCLTGFSTNTKEAWLGFRNSSTGYIGKKRHFISNPVRRRIKFK